MWRKLTWFVCSTPGPMQDCMHAISMEKQITKTQYEGNKQNHRIWYCILAKSVCVDSNLWVSLITFISKYFRWHNSPFHTNELECDWVGFAFKSLMACSQLEDNQRHPLERVSIVFIVYCYLQLTRVHKSHICIYKTQ